MGKDCDGGVMFQTRRCLNGSKCIGESSQSVPCNTFSCKCATLYEHKNFGGESWNIYIAGALADTALDLTDDSGWGNRFSSFEIYPGCSLKLYDIAYDKSEENKIYEYTNNAKTIYKEDESFWSNHRLNDKVSKTW